MPRIVIIYKQKKCTFYEVFIVRKVSDISYFFDFLAPFCIDYSLYKISEMEGCFKLW